MTELSSASPAPRSLAPEFLARLRFTKDQLGTIQSLGECRGRQALFARQAREELETLRTTAIVESSESSNRIEGVLAPLERVEALVLRGSEPKNRSEQEIAGYRDALQLIHEAQRRDPSLEQMPFSPNLLLQLHGVLLRYLPGGGGAWKRTDNEIVERDAQGNLARVRFRATPAAVTPFAVESLTRSYRDALGRDRVDPLIAVPLAILDFTSIHPFTDGNGRIARLLTLLLLYRAGYAVGRYISLERIVEQSKETYYESLEAASQGWHEGRHDPAPWLDYFWGVLIRAYAEFEDRASVLIKGRGSKTEQVRIAVSRRLGPFAISDIEKDCPAVSRDMVRHVLRAMRAEGLIEVRGVGRGAKWTRP